MSVELFSGCTTEDTTLPAPETINTYSSQGGRGPESTSPMHKGKLMGLVPVTSCEFMGAITCHGQKVVINRAPHYLTLTIFLVLLPQCSTILGAGV